ncbi:MAG TPA: hypothetical protein PKA00_14645 [Saprospiraceae bacterium]|nr:hypothetical protein [Saprospiraceae bacterium]HMQ84149.1 hypothetical protein [Saprospiraceae bacterium]
MKLYLNGVISNEGNWGISPIIPDGFHFDGLTPAIRFQKEASKFYHELEVVRLAYSRKNTTDLKLTEHGLGLRWEIGAQLNVWPESPRSRLNLGVGLVLPYNRAQETPLSSASFLRWESIYGIEISVIPRYTYDLSDCFYLEVNLSMYPLSYSYHYIFQDDPVLAPRWRHRSYFRSEHTINAFLLRVGAAMRL